MEPSDGEQHYTEQLIRLPNLSIYYAPPTCEPMTMARVELDLRPTATVYWCGQMRRNICRISTVSFRQSPGRWMIVVRLHRICQKPECHESVQAPSKAAFAEFGLRAADHCVFLPHLDLARFLGAIAAATSFSDTIAVPEGTRRLRG